MATRRDCLRFGGLVVASAALSGCTQVRDALSQPEPAVGWLGPEAGGGGVSDGKGALWRTLNRVAFGPRPGDLERVRTIGLDAYVEEQLHPESLDESAAVSWRLWKLDTLQVDTDFRFEIPKEQVQAELEQAAVVRAVYSSRQLQEVMVDFWSDHFNVSQRKGDSAFLKTTDDDAVIRRHALGKFRDLLEASAKSPAMLYYLDNARNTRTALNENYARELMELHTLGISGGYTQRDVQEVAHCFTGWSIQDEQNWWRGSFVYRPQAHDDGARRVLGVPLPAGLGQKHGERVLEILAGHPSTARFIARKLCRRFVADTGAIPGALVEQIAQTFRRTDGDIRQVLGVLFRSDAFRHGQARKLKRPFDFVVSALRGLNADTDGRGVLTHLRLMGQAPYQWAMPNGYPDRVEAWLPSLLGRWNFALALAANRIPGTRAHVHALTDSARAWEPREQARVLQVAILGRVHPEIDARLRTTLLRPGVTEGLAQAAALLLASPPFQWR